MFPIKVKSFVFGATFKFLHPDVSGVSTINTTSFKLSYINISV